MIENIKQKFKSVARLVEELPKDFAKELLKKIERRVKKQKEPWISTFKQKFGNFQFKIVK